MRVHVCAVCLFAGPLLVSFGRMLHDVVRFGVVFFLVLLAFMCGLTSLYRTHQCENKHFSRYVRCVTSHTHAPV